MTSLKLRWFYKSELEKSGTTTTPINMGAYMHYLVRAVTPLINWPFYLYVGKPDGGHLLLFGRLWRDAKMSEMARGYLSSLVTVASMYTWYAMLSPSNNFVACYVMPWIFYGWWLFTVTYFQHHFDEMVLFEQGAWSYVRGAFETIDRTFGFGIDDFHHNITDCHVIHHLYFTKIPHHGLRKATDAMRSGLKADGFPLLYKHEMTRDFLPKIFSFFTNHWFLVDDEKVITKLRDAKTE